MEKVEHIPNEDYVLRRINPGQHNDGKLDSTAFDDRYNEPSVYWEKIASIDKIVATNPPFDFFLRLKVGDIREKGQNVVHRPDEEHGDDSHCVIIPADGRWTRSKRYGLVGRGIAPITGERVDLPVRGQ